MTEGQQLQTERLWSTFKAHSAAMTTEFHNLKDKLNAVSTERATALHGVQQERTAAGDCSRASRLRQPAAGVPRAPHAQLCPHDHDPFSGGLSFPKPHSPSPHPFSCALLSSQPWPPSRCPTTPAPPPPFQLAACMTLQHKSHGHLVHIYLLKTMTSFQALKFPGIFIAHCMHPSRPPPPPPPGAASAAAIMCSPSCTPLSLGLCPPSGCHILSLPNSVAAS